MGGRFRRLCRCRRHLDGREIPRADSDGSAPGSVPARIVLRRRISASPSAATVMTTSLFFSNLSFCDIINRFRQFVEYLAITSLCFRHFILTVEGKVRGINNAFATTSYWRFVWGLTISTRPRPSTSVKSLNWHVKTETINIRPIHLILFYFEQPFNYYLFNVACMIMNNHLIYLYIMSCTK